ncbi:MAG: PKD domain-containing protein [Methanomicrobiales archaeon]
MVNVKLGIISAIVVGLCLLVMPLAAVHIPTVSEGLLSKEGCYAGVYLGGNVGTLGPNDFMNSNSDGHLYETQYLDHPDSYGETVPGGLDSIDTGIDSFRALVNAVKSGSGVKQVIFSRYYLMNFYPDNDYGKKPYTASPGLDVWAEKVIKQGGVPMIALAPYNGHTLSLSDTYPNGKTGSQILTDLATKLKAVSDRNKDSSGKGATILIWLAPEFNTHIEVNPEINDHVDSPAKKAFRQWFRDAYSLIHQKGGENIQVIWAGNVAQTKDDRKVYWPGNNNNLEQLPSDSVDWVGMTWYSWPDGPKQLSNLKGFYDFYAKERNHPFIFTETSSDGQGDSAQEESLKVSHVTEVYNPAVLSATYPDIKGIVWFNVIKKEAKSGNDPSLVNKNFLIPDGQYQDNGKQTPGLIYSASDPSRQKKMLPGYPEAVMDPYFVSVLAAPVMTPSPTPTTGPYIPPFQADFTVSPVTGVAPLTVKCTDKSTGNPGMRVYNFGDETSVTGPNPGHTYRSPGVYTINLTITKYNKTTNSIMSSVATKTDVITVNQVPSMPLVAKFTASPVSGTAPLKVKFTDQSTGAPTSLHYDFGDGTTATGKNPVHSYLVPGVYDVTLTVLKPDPGTGTVANSVAVKTGLIVVNSTPGAPLPATIKQVDHLMVQVPEPELVFNLFSGDLGLPVAWPMENYGEFSSGGVTFGNVNMELLNSSEEMRQQGLIPDGNGIVGVAFQPSGPIGSTVKTLDAYQVPHGPIIPFNVTENGTTSTLWNNLELSRMMPGSMIFYCEYTFNQTGFRQRMEQSLAAANGGALGITRMKEITVEYADPSVLEKWQRLLPGVPGRTPEFLDGGDGVTVHLVKSGRNAISSITVQVKSLERAKTVLEGKGLLGAVSEGKISINPDTISGLQVYVTE